MVRILMFGVLFLMPVTATVYRSLVTKRREDINLSGGSWMRSQFVTSYFRIHLTSRKTRVTALCSPNLQVATTPIKSLSYGQIQNCVAAGRRRGQRCHGSGANRPRSNEV